MSRSFAAAYRGMCAECDGPIEPGQSVHYTGIGQRGGDLRHVECPEGDAELRPGDAVCSTCWLVHPAGACDR